MQLSRHCTSFKLTNEHLIPVLELEQLLFWLYQKQHWGPPLMPGSDRRTSHPIWCEMCRRGNLKLEGFLYYYIIYIIALIRFLWNDSSRNPFLIQILTLAKDKEPHSHVDKDPWKAKELYQVIYKQKSCFQADRLWNKKRKKYEGSCCTQLTRTKIWQVYL